MILLSLQCDVKEWKEVRETQSLKDLKKDIDKKS